MEDETKKLPPAEDDDRTLVRPTKSPRPRSRSASPPADDAPRLTPGTVLGERYRIVTALGKGGMGEVYRADDLELELPVALKFLPPAREADPARRAQLLDEIKVARQISHPNACRVYDLGEADGVYFLSMEYIDGEDLKSLLQRIGRPAWDKSIELARQLCEGLQAVHEAGVLHRDLKPANLMIDGQGRARLTDFGLAALARELTAGGTLAGTPLYMAPEQFDGQAATVQSDLYSLGLVLYELLTGERAFQPTSFAEAKRLHQRAIPTPPSELRFGFDRAVEEMILRCLAKDPAQRPDSVAEVLTVLTAGGGGLVEGAQIATLLASNLVDNDARVEGLGDTASGELSRLHDRLVRDLAREHGGREIEKGDAFLLLFQRPLEALHFALAYHQRLDELGTERGTELAARVGIHLGEVSIRRNPASDVERGAKPLEVEGFARPMTLRLMELADGRQTLLTQGAFDVARRSARGEIEDPDALSWLAHGDYRFDVAEEPAAVFEVGPVGIAPLTAPAGTADVTRATPEDVILGWRPAPGLEIPQKPGWILERKLGEGGFGEAWRVRHAKSGEVRVYKFCYEREQLSSLQREITVFRLLKEELGLRDDIARILDWNLDEAPYFLEFTYFAGGSLIDWAQTHGGIEKVPLATRIELVAQAATALAAAHSVGVLHKDVKPGNVLVEQSKEATPRAVLTDFGIGQITERERLADKGITVLGLTAMDEESSHGSATGTQIYMAPEILSGQAATTQADLYALGVMLYQMAVGDLRRPMAQGWERRIDDELLREEIAQLVDGNPERRPASAAEVADRLRRLEERRAEREAERQRALQAERSRRRRRVLTVAGSISTVFLVIVSILAVQAMRARADAERRRAQAENLIEFMLTDLYEGLDRIGRLDLLGDVAQSSLDHFESLGARDETPAALLQRGRTLENIGAVLLDQGEADAALSSQRAAVALFTAGSEREPAVESWRRGLSLARLGLGDALREQGDTDGALSAYQSALDTAEELAAASPGHHEDLFTIARGQYAMAYLQRQIGGIDAAFEHADKALEVLAPLRGSPEFGWRQDLLLLNTHALLAMLHRFQNDVEPALAEATRVLDLVTELRQNDPGNTAWSRRLAWSYGEIGILRFMQGNLEGALASAEAAGTAYRDLALADPTRVRWREQMAYIYQLTGYIQTALGRPVRALELYDESVAILEALVASDPTRVQWLRQLGESHLITSELHLGEGRTAAAVASLTEAIELVQRWVALTGDDPIPRNRLAFYRLQLGDIHARRQETDRAREQWLLAVEGIEPITATDEAPHYLDTHAQALMRLGRIEESRPLVEKLLAQGWSASDFLEWVDKSGLRENGSS